MPSYRGQDSYTLGDAVYDFFEDDDADAASADPGSGGAGEAEATSSDPQEDGEEESGTEGEEETDEEDEEDDDSEDDDSENDDSEDDDSSDKDDDSDEETGSTGSTPNPLDDTGSSINMLLMYAATGLCRGEVQRQLAAFSIAAGGALGVNREKATDLHWDRMLGGMYLQTILRGLESRRNQYGQREPVNTVIPLPDGRMFINGFVCPSPLSDLAIVDGVAASLR